MPRDIGNAHRLVTRNGDEQCAGKSRSKFSRLLPAGSYIIHCSNKVHYDGAKNDEAVIQVWGMGPATSTPAEKR